MTGALRLHSDMELYIEREGILKGTARVEDYLPKIKSRFEGLEMECYSSLLNLGELDHDGGYGCRNVVIRGMGTIAGGGKTLAENVIAYEKERLKDYIASVGTRLKEYEKEDTIPGRARPRLINISNSQEVVISGISIENGPGWNVHMIYSDRITTHGCVFRSEGVWNGDGWDPDSSTNCTIFDCAFYTGDDAIAVKSGKNPEGNVIGRPSAHIRIFDCRSAFGHGITIGSEMSGGIDDVSIWDCDMSQSMWGIEIKGTKNGAATSEMCGSATVRPPGFCFILWPTTTTATGRRRLRFSSSAGLSGFMCLANTWTMTADGFLARPLNCAALRRAAMS